MLQVSLAYRLLDRLLANAIEGIKQSGFWALCRFVAEKWRVFTSASAVARVVRVMGRSLAGGTRESLILSLILSIKDGTERSKSSLCYRGYRRVMRGIYAVLRVFRLDRVPQESIFAKPVVWCVLTVTLAPLLPTMAVLGFVLAGGLALLLEMMRRDSVDVAWFSGNKYLYAYVLLYLLMTGAFLWRGGSLQATALTVAFMLFAVQLMNVIQTRDMLKTMLGLLTAVGAIVALIGLYQFFVSGAQTASSWVDREAFDIATRVYSTLGNPNVLGTYFVLILPFATVFLIAARGRVLRLFSMLALLAMGAALVLTYSRGAYLGILIAMALFFVLLDKRLIVPGILAVGIAIILMPDAVIGRFLSIGDMTDTSTVFRVSIWIGAGAMIRDHWLIGIGPGEGAWWAVYPAYALPAVSTEHTHNLFLQVLAEFGVLGFLIFLLILYHFYKNVIVTIRDDWGEARLVAIAAISAMTGVLVMGMWDYALYNFRLQLLFWAILAIGLVNRKLGSKEVAA